MDIYKKLYYRLFAAIADAVDLLDRQEASDARDRLISAMQDAEESVLSEDGANPSDSFRHS